MHLPLEWLHLTVWAAVFEAIGALFVGVFSLRAFVCLFQRRGLVAARLLVAEGAIWALSFMVAATLIKMILLNTWMQIGVLAATLTLRTVMKRLFTWEESRLRQSL